MNGVVFIYILFVLSAIYFTISLNKSIMSNKIKNSNNIHRFNTSDGHGLKSVRDGLTNNIFVTIGCGILIFDFNNGFTNIPMPFYELILTISMCVYSYSFSEIKHLSDGVSKTEESNIFFIKYSVLGMLGLLINLMLIFFILEDTNKIVKTLLVFTLIFLLGMGDLLQIKNINKFGFYEDLLQIVFILFQIPINIIKATFIKKYREIFLKTLQHNFKNIYYGIQIGLSKLKLLNLHSNKD